MDLTKLSEHRNLILGNRTCTIPHDSGVITLAISVKPSGECTKQQVQWPQTSPLCSQRFQRSATCPTIGAQTSSAVQEVQIYSVSGAVQSPPTAAVQTGSTFIGDRRSMSRLIHKTHPVQFWCHWVYIHRSPVKLQKNSFPCAENVCQKWLGRK